MKETWQQMNRRVFGLIPGLNLKEAAWQIQLRLGFPVEHATAYFDDQEREELTKLRSYGLLPPFGPSGDEQDELEIERLIRILGITREEAKQRIKS